ncbi:MAG: hypothetical protein LQ339_007517 [Xanthoria mediterranea]|nr:MAG: hypothetical protein LQ339_007517 [Xanthoria mediterranea]
MSYLIVPSRSHPTTTTNLSTTTPPTSSSKGAPSAPGIHDTLRSNLPTAPGLTNTPISTHPLEARLAAWQSTQDESKMAALRRNFGIGEPVRRGMEIKIAREGEWRPMALGGSAGVSGDILVGRDAEITWEDVYTGSELREGADFHAEVERKLGMDW